MIKKTQDGIIDLEKTKINSARYAKKKEIKRGGDNTKNHETLLKQCLVLLSSNGFLCWKSSTGAIRSGNRFQRYGLVGSSDIIAISPPEGTFCAIEIKTGSAVQNKNQKAFEKAVKKVGGVYIVVRSLQDLKDWING